MKNMLKSKKGKIIIAVGVGVVLLAGAGLKVNADIQNTKKIESTFLVKNKEVAKELSNFEMSVSNMYTSSKKTYLNEKLNEEQVAALIDRLEKMTIADYDLKSKELLKMDKEQKRVKVDLLKELSVIHDRIKLQSKVNDLFISSKEKAIKGSSLKLDLAVRNDLKKADANLLDETKMKDFDEWEESLYQLIQATRKQVDEIDKATDLVNKLFQEKNVSDKATRKELQSALDQIKIIKNEKAEKELKTRCNTVSDELTKREKGEAEKKQVDAQKQGKQGEVITNADGSVEFKETAVVAADNQSNGDAYSGEAATGTTTANGGTTSPATGGGTGATPPVSGGTTPPATGGGTVTTPPVQPPVQPPIQENVHGNHCIAGTYRTYEAAYSAGKIAAKAQGMKYVAVISVYCEHGIEVGFEYSI